MLWCSIVRGFDERFLVACFFFFFSSRRRHTRCLSDWSSDVCSSDLSPLMARGPLAAHTHLHRTLLLDPGHEGAPRDRLRGRQVLRPPAVMIARRRRK